MKIERTISGMMGKGSISHNERKFIAENVDATRTVRNEVLISDKLNDVYHELFDDALERYNAKQKRNDRKIQDYYEHIRTSKQEKLFHEVIFQIGNKDDTECFTEEGNLAKQALLEFAQDFQKRNPQFRVFGIFLHLDEATPHLHIDFVPYTTGSKRGLDTRVSMKQALASRGFIGKGKENTECNQWIKSEKEELAKVAEKYGIIWRHEDIHREHLSVLDFKKQMRSKEVAELEKKSEMLQEQNEIYQEVSDQFETQIDQLEQDIRGKQEERDKAITEAETAQKKADRQEKRLDKATQMTNNIQQYSGEFYKPVDELLPEADFLESAKSYRENKAKPKFAKLQNLLYSAYRAYLDIKDQLKRLQNRYDMLERSNHTLAEKNQDLTEDNMVLRDKVADLLRLKRVIGEDRADSIIMTERQREIAERNARKKHRRVLDIGAR